MHCVTHLKLTYQAYVAPCFTKETFLKCYSSIIHPLLDKSKWPHIEPDEILPQNVSRPHPTRENSQFHVYIIKALGTIQDVVLITQPMQARRL